MSRKTLLPLSVSRREMQSHVKNRTETGGGRKQRYRAVGTSQRYHDLGRTQTEKDNTKHVRRFVQRFEAIKRFNGKAYLFVICLVYWRCIVMLRT